MEPSDPPDQPESSLGELPNLAMWAETSAWVPSGPPTPSDPPPTPEDVPTPAVWDPPPPAIVEPPSPADYAPPSAADYVPSVPDAMPRVKVRRARGSRTIVVWSLIAEVVLVAAVGNQWLTKTVEHWLQGRQASGLSGDLVLATQTYDWRLNPPSHDSDHSWPASLTMIAVVFILTAAILFALSRGGLSRGRAFVSALLAVVFATQVGLIAGGLVLNINIERIGSANGVLYGDGPDIGSGVTHRISSALFGISSPSGYSFVGSLAFGVVVGLAAMFAASRAGGDVDPRVTAVRAQSPFLLSSPAPAPAVWTPPTGDQSQRSEGGRHSRDD